MLLVIMEGPPIGPNSTTDALQSKPKIETASFIKGRSVVAAQMCVQNVVEKIYREVVLV